MEDLAFFFFLIVEAQISATITADSKQTLKKIPNQSDYNLAVLLLTMQPGPESEAFANLNTGGEKITTVLHEEVLALVTIKQALQAPEGHMIFTED